MKSTIFLLAAVFVATVSAWEPRAAPDDGGLKPYIEELGRNHETYQALILNSLVETESEEVVQAYRDIILPPITDIFPNMSSAECIGCQVALTTLRGFVNILNKDYEDMRDILIAVCTVIMNKAGRPGPEICPGVLDNYGPLVVQIVQDKAHQQKVVDACIFLNSCPPPEFDDGVEPIDGYASYQSPFHESRQDPEFFQAFGAHSSEVLGDGTRPRRDADVFRVVQISDVHFDTEYAEGAVRECGFHVCCRSNYNGTGIARHFGEYTCNAPTQTVELFLRKAAALQPDLVLQTGDTPPHHLWYETLEKQIDSTKWLAKKLHDHIAVPILPAIGNHDPFPSNMYYVPNDDTKLLHETMIGSYSVLSADPGIQATMRTGGYYEYEVQNGLRALVYNSNYGYTDNYFNLLSHYEETDFLAMKQFVVNRLVAARHDGAKVILIAHHPVGDGIIAFDTWVSEVAIEYHDVIVLHVGGHKHTDLFKLFISESKQWASAMQFAAPSSNTYNIINPSLRVYLLDASTHKLLDFEQYYMDLEAANEAANNSSDPTYEPDIQLAYKAREEYPLSDMSAASWHELAISMLQNTTLLNTYQTNFGTRVSSDLRDSTCTEGDKDCHQTRVCSVVSSTILANMRCNRDGVRIPTGVDPPEPEVSTNGMITEVTTVDNSASKMAPASFIIALLTWILLKP